MTAAQALLLTAAAATGGALNSVAGGGTFIAFPALLFAGVAPGARECDRDSGVVAGRGS